LTVTDGAAGSTPATATLTGTAIAAAALAITPSSADFGAVKIPASKTTTFTMQNTGGTATDVLTVAVTDAEFTVTSDLCTGLPLAANARCTFTLTFTPSGPAGVRQALVNAAQASGTPLASAQVTGTVVAATLLQKLSMTPPMLDFGTTTVGAPVGPTRFTVTSTSGTVTGPLAVAMNDSASSPGGASQFTFTTTCSAALPPADSCQIDVTFAPTTAGTSSAIFYVSDGTNSTYATVTGQAL
jgi:hypothetical protein